MLRLSRVCLVKSHQLKKSQHPDAGSRYGRNYNRAMIRYGFTGFGISTYSPRKNRSFKIRPLPDAFTNRNPSAAHLTPTTKSLSPQWRPFALADGGVLIAHPSHSQVMKWSQSTLAKEAEATGQTAMDNWVDTRIQSIIADNTLENISLSHWRRRHLWTLVKQQGKIQRNFTTPDYLKGIRSNVYGRSTIN
mmetsp:Transcript_8620/g.9724  ORF Transcript_8620/g.9724 Transcript_8620/m.9724 type:complete len:191 (-) Transcript_8620:98-670(-)